MPYRPTEKTEARKAATRERIVAAALDQVAEGGYASAGVQSVAARAEVAVGTVYRHFPSKAELFAEVFRRASQRELDVMSDVAAADDGRPASERIAAAAEVFCRRALAGPGARLRPARRASRPGRRGRAPDLPPRLPRHARGRPEGGRRGR